MNTPPLQPIPPPAPPVPLEELMELPELPGLPELATPDAEVAWVVMLVLSPPQPAWLVAAARSAARASTEPVRYRTPFGSASRDPVRCQKRRCLASVMLPPFVQIPR